MTLPTSGLDLTFTLAEALAFVTEAATPSSPLAEDLAWEAGCADPFGDGHQLLAAAQAVVAQAALVIYAADRKESESCERSTPGCCVSHTESAANAECEPW